jgi:hypothetical protein
MTMNPKETIAFPVRLVGNRLSDEQVGTLLERGFTSFENVAYETEIAELRARCERLIFKSAGAKEGAFFDFVGDAPFATTRLTQLLVPSNSIPSCAVWITTSD